MSSPYYDQKLSKDAAKALLAKIHAEKDAGRSTADALVYKIDGGGEAMVTADPKGSRVRLYKGVCPC